MSLTLKARELPYHAVFLKSGELSIRLDGAKFGNMNRIQWRGHDLAVDLPGAHYGSTVKFRGDKGFVGSGHKETGVAEKMILLKASADGTDVPLSEGKTVEGKNVCVRRKSMIKELLLDSMLCVSGNMIRECTEVTAATSQKIQLMYHFMHPWKTDFTDFYGKSASGKVHQITFKSDNSFYLHDYTPVAIWHDGKTNCNVVTVIMPGEGTRKTVRMLWDRQVYRKDYIVDYIDSVFPAGQKARYEVRTGFFMNEPNEDWRIKGTALAESLKNADFPDCK